MAHALQIDTLAFSKRLKAAGADDKLAEAIVEGITAADTSELATQADITAVKADLAEVKNELKEDISNVRTEIAEVRTEIAQTGNRTVMMIGGILGLLFVVDKLFPLFGL